MNAVPLPHSSTFVRLRAVDGHSPPRYDLGPLALALICYDNVIVETSHDSQLANIVQFFDRSDDLPGLFSLLADRSLRFLNYDYMPGTMRSGGWLVGVQLIKFAQSASGRPLRNEFKPKVLNGPLVRQLFRGRRSRSLELSALAMEAVIEEGLEQVPSIFRNAEEDFFDRHRCAIRLLQEVTADARFANIPELEESQALVRQDISRDGRLLHDVEWIVTPRAREELTKRGLRLPKPERLLTRIVQAVQTVDTASRLGSDIWPAEDDTNGIADKVYEAAVHSTRIPDVVEVLVESVRLPDLSAFILDGRISAREVLEVRARSHSFRAWLRDQVNSDADAAVAYLAEAMQGSSLNGAPRRALRLAAAVGSAVVSAKSIPAFNPAVGPVAAAAIGAIASEGMKVLIDAALCMNRGWTPYVFGEWYKARIARHIKREGK